MGNCFGLFKTSDQLLEEENSENYGNYNENYDHNRGNEQVYHPQPGVRKLANELTEEEQMMIFKRIEIIQKIPTYSYEESPKTTEECIICIDAFLPEETVRVLPCRHMFHTDCINQWLMCASECPTCKHNLDDMFAHSPAAPNDCTSQLSYDAINVTCCGNQQPRSPQHTSRQISAHSLSVGSPSTSPEECNDEPRQPTSVQPSSSMSMPNNASPPTSP